MAKKSAVRTVLTLDCECGKYSYHTEKNKRNTTERLELKKFNPHLNKMTIHKEIK